MKNLPEILAKEIFDLYKTEVRETLIDYSQVWDSEEVEDSDDFAKIEAEAIQIFVKQRLLFRRNPLLHTFQLFYL